MENKKYYIDLLLWTALLLSVVGLVYLDQRNFYSNLKEYEDKSKPKHTQAVVSNNFWYDTAKIQGMEYCRVVSKDVVVILYKKYPMMTPEQMVWTQDQANWKCLIRYNITI